MPNDYGPPEMHFAQVAVNAMFQFFEERNKRMATNKALMEMRLSQRQQDQAEREAAANAMGEVA